MWRASIDARILSSDSLLQQYPVVYAQRDGAWLIGDSFYPHAPSRSLARISVHPHARPLALPLARPPSRSPARIPVRPPARKLARPQPHTPTRTSVRPAARPSTVSSSAHQLARLASVHRVIHPYAPARHFGLPALCPPGDPPCTPVGPPCPPLPDARAICSSGG